MEPEYRQESSASSAETRGRLESLQQAASANNDSDDTTHYFTHQIDGRLYGGWFRRLPGCRIEVFTRTKRGTAFLGKISSEEEARRLLEVLVRKDESTERPVEASVPPSIRS